MFRLEPYLILYTEIISSLIRDIEKKIKTIKDI